MQNDLKVVKEVILRNRNQKVSWILNKLLKKGGLDAVNEYLDFYQEVFKHHSNSYTIEDKLNELECLVEGAIVNKEKCDFIIKTLTQYKDYVECRDHINEKKREQLNNF